MPRGGSHRVWCPVASDVRVREWLIRSVDVRGQVDRAGFLSRPAVPSRARARSSLRVGDELELTGTERPGAVRSARL